MYVLTIENPDEAFTHVVARVEWPMLAPAETGHPLRSLFLDSFGFASPLWLQLPAVSASLRIEVSPDRAPVTWHGLTVARRHADMARNAIAALTRLDGVDNAVIVCPGDLEDFGANFATLDGEWFTPDTEPSTTPAGGDFYDTGRIFDRLSPLMISGVAMGHAVRYQATLRPARPSPDLVRRARKSVAALERHPGAPKRIVEAQSRVVGKLDRAEYLADEAVSISPGGQDWLLGWLDANLAIERSAGRSAQQRSVPVDDDALEAFGNHVHPALLLGEAVPQQDPVLVPRYWTEDEAAALFRCDSFWRPGMETPPPLSPLPLFFRSVREPEPSRRPETGFDGPFYFVSYARKDLHLIRPILDRVEAAGKHIWMDNQIQLSEEWDVRLETMITRSAGILAFLSPNYVASKHCRRELKFADALNKSIFASALAEFPRENGIGYIFASLQYTLGPQEKIVEKLMSALG